jgi:hypothetical protein
MYRGTRKSSWHVVFGCPAWCRAWLVICSGHRKGCSCFASFIKHGQPARAPRWSWQLLRGHRRGCWQRRDGWQSIEFGFLQILSPSCLEVHVRRGLPERPQTDVLRASRSIVSFGIGRSLNAPVTARGAVLVFRRTALRLRIHARLDCLPTSFWRHANTLLFGGRVVARRERRYAGSSRMRLRCETKCKTRRW